MCSFVSYRNFQKQTEPNVRNKILYLIQAWAHAFRNEPKYKVVQDTYQIMKVEGKHVLALFVLYLWLLSLERHPNKTFLMTLHSIYCYSFAFAIYYNAEHLSFFKFQ